VQGDPSSCSFFKWELDYRRWLRSRLRDGGTDVVEKEEVFSVVMRELAEMKQEIRMLNRKLIRPSVVVDRVCIMYVLLGCVIGMFVSLFVK
jgi:hypothetical protein